MAAYVSSILTNKLATTDNFEFHFSNNLILAAADNCFFNCARNYQNLFLSFRVISRFYFMNTSESIILAYEDGPTMCPKIRTYRRCTYVLTSSTRCYDMYES